MTCLHAVAFTADRDTSNDLGVGYVACGEAHLLQVLRDFVIQARRGFHYARLVSQLIPFGRDRANPARCIICNLRPG